VLVAQGGDAEVEVRGGIDIGGQESLFGSVEGEGVGEFGLGDFTTVGAVEEETATLDDGLGGDGCAIAQKEGITLVEVDASEGSVAEGVFAGFLGGTKAHGDGVCGGAEDGTETELRLGFADPALAGKIGNRHVAAGRGRGVGRRFKRRFAGLAPMSDRDRTRDLADEERQWLPAEAPRPRRGRWSGFGQGLGWVTRWIGRPAAP